MEEKQYIYRRDDNDELVEVGWAAMIEQENGFITLPDGVSARRCLHLERERDALSQKAVIRRDEGTKEIVSDAMGFPCRQLQDFEVDRQTHGFSGIEFRTDPTEPSFVQVVSKSPGEFQRYMKHRGFVDRNKTGDKFFFAPGEFERAIERAKGA
jgi:hypothetical protein